MKYALNRLQDKLQDQLRHKRQPEAYVVTVLAQPGQSSSPSNQLSTTHVQSRVPEEQAFVFGTAS